jgi:hypothetical protein
LSEEEHAAALLAHSGVAPAGPGERAGMLAAFGACRAMSDQLHAADLGDTAPLALPRYPSRD